MLKDIVDVQVLDGYKLQLRFEDGVQGIVDISQIVPFEGVFEPLKDRTYFRGVKVNPELGTVVWPNDADLDPDVLYALVTGQPIRVHEHSGEPST